MSRARPDPQSNRVADTAWGRALALLAVLLFVVLSMAGPGQTLCIGADAHFAVESASAACCAPVAQPAAAPECDAGRPSAAEPCHDPASDDGCTDVRLGIDPADGRTRRHAPDANAAAATPAASRPFPVLQVPSILPRPPRSAAVAPFPGAPRTLVLRC
jgi:hypothetical protein